MREGYVVSLNGKPVGWVHAATADEAIRKVCKVTCRAPDQCAANPVTTRK